MSKVQYSRAGKLLEISPFGTGFIEDMSTGARYGFHISMLPPPVQPANSLDLTGRKVRFNVRHDGTIAEVTTYAA